MKESLAAMMSNFKGGELGLVEFAASLAFAIFAGLVAMYLYRMYFREAFDRNDSLANSFVVIAPSVCSIFWAIQYSLPLSLGLLGALSFVRFRAPVKKAEDIGFILAVISISLLTSVYRFYAAGMMIVALGGIVIVKKWLVDKNFRIFKSGTVVTAFVSSPSNNLEQIHGDVSDGMAVRFPQNNRFKMSLMEAIKKDAGYNLRYSMILKDFDEETVPNIVSTLQKQESVKNVEIFVENSL